MTTTQRFSLVIRCRGETLVRRVDWPLDSVLRALLSVEFRARSLDEALPWKMDCDDLPLDLSLPVGAALSSAAIPLSPSKPLRAFVQVPDVPYVHPQKLQTQAPSTPPTRPPNLVPPGGSAPFGSPPRAPAMAPSAPGAFQGLPSPTAAVMLPTLFEATAPAPVHSLPAPVHSLPAPVHSLPTPVHSPPAPVHSLAALEEPMRPATVRYFTRMSPQRVFPLRVSIAPRAVTGSLGLDVARAVSESFALAQGSLVEIEPLLPGCTCYPAKLSLDPRAGVELNASFWVVAQVLGKLPGAEVLVRHGARTLSVPLRVKVVEPRAAQISGFLSLAVPFMAAVMKHYHLESQLSEGFGHYAKIVRATLFTLGPAELFAVLFSLSVGLWLWARPREGTAQSA